MKIKLTNATIHKYKSILKPQSIDIDPAVTTLVGMNESGKTTVLEALAKTNYFEEDEDFKFNITHDYPRNELVDFENDDVDQIILVCTYDLGEVILKEIDEKFGKEVFSAKSFTYTYNYKENNSVGGIIASQTKFLENRAKQLVLSKATKETILKLKTISEVATIEQQEGDTDLATFKVEISSLVSSAATSNWENPIAYNIYSKIIKPQMPKFWYFDEYYHLGGKLNINEIINGHGDEKVKTAKALLELARIKPEEIINSQDYERYIALLEASSNKITNEIFKYWSTNKNLDIEFRIQDVGGQKFLDIRVRSQRHKITLPLDRRSKGFNWFFSFIIWFSKIQADKNSDYILLLDEPGLNLHASAQNDLLRFIEDLSQNYQIIYSTHSPFMVESSHLDRVRTCLESEDGTIISDSIQEKDPNTLFPLQAALGYDIAQNLFISKNNLLVEGPADLLYITILSSILEGEKRIGLKDSYTIVPVGGLDKVTTFISLLRGQKLNVVCLLDSFTDQKGKQRVDDLIMHKIIREKNIRFFDEFANNGMKTADIEDLFTKDEYLSIFNQAFKGDHSEIKIGDLDSSIETILKQINKVIKKDRFNHYRPANKLNQLGVDKTFFSEATLANFEKMFVEINKLI